MLNPALFIGLGTTGVDILVNLQRLILEHYGQPSLPIFAYVALETDEAKKVELPSWASSEINLIHPIITSTDAIKNALDQKDYLKDWLNTNLLNIPGGDFKDGAANIRMAGRLCLWENWEEVVRQLQNANNKITATENIRDTDTFLRRRYVEIGKTVSPNEQLVGNLPNIYIVGTLCGGTCSGMFIDIGYYIKELTGLWAKNLPDRRIPKVIGLFTVYDSSSLNNANNQQEKKLSANCWAALIEYDYWCHPDSRYKVTFPNGTTVGPTNEKPVDWLYLLSCSAGDESNLRDNNGAPDKDALKNMAAMALFTETVGGLFGEKGNIRTNFRRDPRALEANQDEHTSCITTYGIATVWYPKYRIAEAASCLYGKMLCKQWKGEIDANTKQSIENQVKVEWNRILEQSLPILTSSPEGSLEAQIENSYATRREDLLNLSPDNLIRAIKERLRLDLGENGYFDRHISDPGRQSQFKEGIIGAIEETIKSQIDSEKNLAYASHFLKCIDNAIKTKIEKLPTNYPAPDLGKARGDLKQDGWSKVVFKDKEVLTQKKEELIEDCKEYEISHLEKIRDFRIRKTLEEVRENIGVGMQLPEGKIITGERSAKHKLDAVAIRLDECIEAFDKRAKEMGTNIGVTQDVLIITQRDSVQEDIDILSATLKNMSPMEKDSIIGKIMTKDEMLQLLHKFLGYGVIDFSFKEIYNPIRDVLLSECLKKRADFNIAEELQKKYPTPVIRRFAKHALPHLELTGDLASETLGVPPEFIIGKDSSDNVPQINTLEAKLNDAGAPDRIGFANLKQELELDHMLIFYKEEGLIYMDENLATASLFENRYKEAEDNDNYGLHTHKDGRYYFDIWIPIRRREAEEIMEPLVKDIFSFPDDKEEDKWKSSEIFGVEKDGRLALRNIPGSDLVLTLENMVEKLAQEKRLFNYLKVKLREKLEEIGKQGFDERLTEHLNRVEKATGAQKAVDPIEVRNTERDKYRGPEGIIKRMEEKEYVPKGSLYEQT